MKQETVFKRIFFSVVILYHVHWLHVLLEPTKKEGFDQLILVFSKAFLDFFNFIFLVQWEMLVDDACHNIIFKIDLCP